MDNYMITINEPWEIASDKKRNKILGKVIKTVSKKTIVFISDNEVDIDGKKGRIFILKPRYSNQVFSGENHLSGTINAGMYALEKFDDKDEKFLENNSRYVFIGNLNKLYS